MKSGTDDGEDYFPISYVADEDSPESEAYENMILGCYDHSSSKNICSQANKSSICTQHEVYSYSFCRKTCGFCEETDYVKHLLWRIVAAEGFHPTWPIAEIKFFAKHTDVINPVKVVSVFSSSNYPNYEATKAFDNNNSTYWLPNMWGIHEPSNDYIGIELEKPDNINAISIVYKYIEGSTLPKIIHVESSQKLMDNFIHRWIYRLDSDEKDGVYLKPKCPALWKLYSIDHETSCIRLFYKHLSWQQAKSQCKNYQADLISFHSSHELSFFTSKFHYKGPVWIGLNDHAQKGNYVWSDNSKADYFNWSSGDPSDQIRSDEEDCVTLNNKGEYQESMCHNTYFFACKKTAYKSEKYESDPKVPEVESPILFLEDNYLEPVINNSIISKKLDLYKIKYPKLVEIPQMMNENTTFDNRYQRLNEYINQLRENIQNNQQNQSDTQPEQIKVETPTHRFLQKQHH